MEIQHHEESNEQQPIRGTNNNMAANQKLKMKRLILLLLNILLLLIGSVGSPIFIRDYFVHGGARKWFSSFLQTAASPLLLVPLILSFLRRIRLSPSTKPKLFHLTPPLLLYCTVIGLITGIGNFLYTYGVSYLPVSTSTLLVSTQLGFTAVFAFFIVRQKFTPSSLNAVVLLTFGAVVLGVHANGDRPEGESNAKYYVGFMMTLAAAVLYGAVLPLVELMYMKSKQAVTYTLVMEMQLVISISATLFCVVGMAVNNDFQAISREAGLFGLGEAKYYLVIMFTAITAQCFALGLVGTINYSSALLGGIMIAASLPITEVFAIFLFHEKFDGEKGVSLALSLWGTASYFYGEYRDYKRSKAIQMEAQFPISMPVSDHP